jgi:hypothetical protein
MKLMLVCDYAKEKNIIIFQHGSKINQTAGMLYETHNANENSIVVMAYLNSGDFSSSNSAFDLVVSFGAL